MVVLVNKQVGLLLNLTSSFEYSVYRYSHTVPACMVHKKICEVEDIM